MEAVHHIIETGKTPDKSGKTSHAEVMNSLDFSAPDFSTSLTNLDIVIWINELHKSLDNDFEAGLKIKHLGKEVVFYIDHIAHQNQSMIYFKGHTEEGKLVHFVKPTTKLKIQLEPLKRRHPEHNKQPFGFDSWGAFDNAKQLNA